MRKVKRLKNRAPVATLVSFPKSGRTWVRVMLDRLDVPMNYNHDGSQYALSKDFRSLKPTQGNYQGERIVFLHRDPRDTAVSGFFQKSLRNANSYEETLSTFLRDPCLGLEKIIVFNLAWIEAGPSMNLPFASIQYERLRQSPLAGVNSMVRWLCPERVFEADRLQKVVEKSSFSAMQAQERDGAFEKKYGSILKPTDSTNQESFKVRRGVVGGYKDYFSADDIAFADQLLARYDYSERLFRLNSAALV